MTQLGESSKPTFSYQAYDGNSFPNQMVEKYTAPTKMKIITLGGWIGGWNGTAHCELAVFAADGTLLGASAEFIVANEGAAANGNVSLYTEDLVTPVTIDVGVDFYVGTIRNRADAVQWSTGSNAYTRYEATGSYPGGDLGGIVAKSAVTRRIGMYVANYQPVAGAWIYRSGVWVQADAVQAYRTGAWADVDAVQLYRSGAWTDAQ